MNSELKQINHSFIEGLYARHDLKDGHVERVGWREYHPNNRILDLDFVFGEAGKYGVWLKEKVGIGLHECILNFRKVDDNLITVSNQVVGVEAKNVGINTLKEIADIMTDRHRDFMFNIAVPEDEFKLLLFKIQEMLVQKTK